MQKAETLRHDPSKELGPLTIAPGTPAQPSASASTAIAADDVNPCGLDKETTPPPRKRRLGGLLVAVLPCGTVVGIVPIPRGESLTQVHALLGQIRRYHSISFVVYDNACALAHFVRRADRARRTSIAMLLAHVCYVIDRFHLKNHTACLNPSHRRYMPEVDVYAHAKLQGVNTAINESFNAWIDRFVYSANNMHPVQFRVFVLLLVHLWNTYIVPRGVDTTVVQPMMTAYGHLRRVRTRLD
jgi:hypothetical protein